MAALPLDQLHRHKAKNLDKRRKLPWLFWWLTTLSFNHSTVDGNHDDDGDDFDCIMHESIINNNNNSNNINNNNNRRPLSKRKQRKQMIRYSFIKTRKKAATSEIGRIATKLDSDIVIFVKAFLFFIVILILEHFPSTTMLLVDPNNTTTSQILFETIVNSSLTNKTDQDVILNPLFNQSFSSAEIVFANDTTMAGTQAPPFSRIMPCLPTILTMLNANTTINNSRNDSNQTDHTLANTIAQHYKIDNTVMMKSPSDKFIDRDQRENDTEVIDVANNSTTSESEMMMNQSLSNKSVDLSDLMISDQGVSNLNVNDNSTPQPLISNQSTTLLSSQNIYRYYSQKQENDLKTLLSRYPSLRLPPPPPEFADDFDAGITEVSTVSGSSVDIPCNTSWIEDEVSLVLWFRGDTGVPIYRVDARNVPLSKAIHTTTEEGSKRLYFDMKTQPPVLRIQPVLASDAAEYRCRVDFRQSRTQNVIVLLNVTVPPKELLIMDVEGQKLEGVIGPYDEGSNVILICEAEGGKPSPSVQWYQASHLIDSSYTTGPHGLVRNELNIRNLNRSDFMSILTCRATNNNVTEPISATVILDMNLRPLDVKILPKSYLKSKSSVMIDPRIAFILPAGSKAEFQCQSTGSRPAAQISWWLGQERLSNNVRDSVNEDGNATISTIVFMPSIEDNGKMLTCRADNLPMPHTALKDERLLNVQFAPQLRISFGTNIQTDSIREGSDVYMECQVKANPAVKEVVWLHEGRPIHSLMAGDNDPNGIGSTVIMTNQSLVIQKVHRSHRGRYQCVAFNEQGETISDPLYLKVNFAPSCKPGQKMQYGVSRNEQIRIRCEVEAEPSNDLTFRWTLNTSGTETSVEWDSFTVNGTTSIATYRPESSLDYGTLACWAQNSIGVQKKPCVYSVVPAGRPDAVRGCAITNHSMSTLLVECIPGDDGGLRQHFNLEVYIGNGGPPNNQNVEESTTSSQQQHQHLQTSSSTTSTSSSSSSSLSSQPQKQRLHSNHSSSQPNFIVSSLTPGTPYTLVLYATNAKGRSHSVSLSAVTLSSPEKHIARGSFEQIVVHPILGILIGIVTTIVITVIILILLIRGRIRSRDHYHRQQHLPEQSSLACTRRSLNNGNSNGNDPTSTDALITTTTTSLTNTANGDLKLKRMNGDGGENGKTKQNQAHHQNSLKKKISPKKQSTANINAKNDEDKRRQQLEASSSKEKMINGINDQSGNGDVLEKSRLVAAADINGGSPDRSTTTALEQHQHRLSHHHHSSHNHHQQQQQHHHGHGSMNHNDGNDSMNLGCVLSSSSPPPPLPPPSSSSSYPICSQEPLLSSSALNHNTTTTIASNLMDNNCNKNNDHCDFSQTSIPVLIDHGQLHHQSQHYHHVLGRTTTSTYDTAIRSIAPNGLLHARPSQHHHHHHPHHSHHGTQMLELSSTASSTGLSSSSTSSSPNLMTNNPSNKPSMVNAGPPLPPLPHHLLYPSSSSTASPNHHHQHHYADGNDSNQYSQYHPYLNAQYISPHHYEANQMASLYPNQIGSLYSTGSTISPSSFASNSSPHKLPPHLSTTLYEQDEIMNQLYDNDDDQAGNLAYTPTLFFNSIESTGPFMATTNAATDLTSISSNHPHPILYYNPSDEITVEEKISAGNQASTPIMMKTKSNTKRSNVTLLHDQASAPTTTSQPPSSSSSLTIDGGGLYVPLNKASKVSAANSFSHSDTSNNNGLTVCGSCMKNACSLVHHNNNGNSKNQCPGCQAATNSFKQASMTIQATSAEDDSTGIAGGIAETLMMMIPNRIGNNNENNVVVGYNSTPTTTNVIMNLQKAEPEDEKEKGKDQNRGNGNPTNCDQTNNQLLYLRHSSNLAPTSSSASSMASTAAAVITSSASATLQQQQQASSSHEICFVNKQQQQQQQQQPKPRNGTAV